MDYEPDFTRQGSSVLRQNLNAVETAFQENGEQRFPQTDANGVQHGLAAELAKLGFANMADYMRANPNGDPYLDFSQLTRDQTAALQEVTVEYYVDGRGEDARNVKRVRFKLADKRAALVDLGRHLGIFRDRLEHTGKDGGPIESADVVLDDSERVRRIEAIFERARIRRDRQAVGSRSLPRKG
jgi:hypothetical protein